MSKKSILIYFISCAIFAAILTSINLTRIYVKNICIEKHRQQLKEAYLEGAGYALGKATRMMLNPPSRAEIESGEALSNLVQSIMDKTETYEYR